MKIAYHNHPGRVRTAKLTNWMTTLLMCTVLAACGGGSGNSVDTPLVTAECDPNDASTFAECGTVMIALTDADGDFLNYTLEVASVKLMRVERGRVSNTRPLAISNFKEATSTVV